MKVLLDETSGGWPVITPCGQPRRLAHECKPPRP